MAGKFLLALLGICGLALAEASPAAPPIQELELVRAHRLSWPGNFQPSGLTWCQGRLLTVSDRHDHQVLEIRLNEDGPAEVREHIRLGEIPEPPPLTSPIAMLRQMVLTLFNKQYDWEGASCDADDNLYLASESYSAILALPHQGRPHWIQVVRDPRVQELGLLANHNAGIEGLQWLAPDTFMIAAERSPAGLIRCRVQDRHCVPDQVSRLSGDQTPLNLRAWSITGLSLADGHLYTLERYERRVCKRRLDDFSILGCGRFEQTERTPRLAHRGAIYGQAEGLLVTDQRILVVLDNNGRPQQEEPGSTDTWLFEFRRPADL